MKRLFNQLKARLLHISIGAGLMLVIDCRAASSAYYDTYYDSYAYYLNLYETYGNVAYWEYASVYLNYYDAGLFSDYTEYYIDLIGYKSNTYWQSKVGPNAVTAGYSRYQEYAEKGDLIYTYLK